MLFSRYLWLLLCYAQYARSNLDDYEGISNTILSPSDDKAVDLPVMLGVDRGSGCICRSSQDRNVTVCFGNYECKRFPKIKMKSEVFRVRTTVIVGIYKGELDSLYFLKELEIEANHQLKYLEQGLFRNLSKLQQLSVSYNTGLQAIDEDLFEGLESLRDLTLVNNGFISIPQLTPALRASILPSLTGLDLSENVFETISEDAFLPMEGTHLERLEIHLCRLDFIHPHSFLPLKMLKELRIGENDLSSTLIENFLIKLIEEGINLTRIDLSGMGFRKEPPRKLLDIIARTSIKWLDLAQNQFEKIPDDCFPQMVNIEVLDLRKVFAIMIGPHAFEPTKFPNLKVLLLGGNNLPGIHNKHLSNQLLLLDLSWNKGTASNPMYYEIDRDTFSQSRELRTLNLSYNIIKAIYNYTFRGLEKLKRLSLKNGTIYYIGPNTFSSTKHLEMLNLANNPLTASSNLTSCQFEGLNELKVLILSHCGIKHFYDDDNIFEMMPNLTHLILKGNLLYYITAETLKPLKFLQVLDLSENLITAWWSPLFLAAGVTPQKLFLADNKISQFSLSMIQDISYLLENTRNSSMEIDLMNNMFDCECSAMYKTYLWLEVNASMAIKQYFVHSNFQCSSPDLWEDKRVAEYLNSIKSLHCYMYEKISKIMVVVWTLPSLVTIIMVAVSVTIVYKYRIYIRYWIFLAKIALGRKFIRNDLKADNIIQKRYKYDAFVSYSNEDNEFVTEMIHQMESNPPYLKLCVYERDFEIGSFISESVLSSINHSKYIILIISNNFAKSQWCRWETQLAEYHRLFLEDGTTYDPLVLIRLEEVESKYLTTTLKYLLKTKIYLPWHEQRSEEFWEKLRNILVKNKQ